MTAGEHGKILSAPYVLEYTYRRSTGPIIGRFVAGLAEGKILGGKTKSGKVVVPPAEYDPETSEPVTDLVEVGTSGVVVTWSWQGEPRPRQPMEKPFAWALVKLDGADTSMLHAVDAGEMSRMSTGMRVKARFRKEPQGNIGDIICFEPDGSRGTP